MVIGILARAFVHASTPLLAVLFGFGLGACGGTARPPTEGGVTDSMTAGDVAADVDLDVDAGVDAPDATADAPDNGDTADTDAGADAARHDAGGDGGATDAADAADVSPPACAGCTTGDWGTPSPVGMIPTVKLAELSGIASSQRHPGTLYAHNDSGDSARFFAIDESARMLAEIQLNGGTAIDWEDIAVGQCPTGSCVFIADIGDNDLNRSDCAIYRVPEPDTLPTDGSVITASYERFPFVYPDGWHNAETLLVDPVTHRIFIVTKESEAPSRVYELPTSAAANATATMIFVGTLSVGVSAGPITGGAFSPCGDRILVRSYTSMFELARAAAGDLVSIFSAAPVLVPLAVEPQGEAVTYAADGRRYFTASELDDSPSVSLNAVDCRNPLR
jgi:hypothetical protein